MTMSRVSAAVAVLVGTTAGMAMLKTKNSANKIDSLFFILFSWLGRVGWLLAELPNMLCCLAGAMKNPSSICAKAQMRMETIKRPNGGIAGCDESAQGLKITNKERWVGFR
jgi:hypothetical protein